MNSIDPIVSQAQSLFLHSSCLYPDSQVIKEPRHWILSTPSCPHRWANAVVRAEDIEQSAAVFSHPPRNFVVHNWDCFSQYPKTQTKLKELNFSSIGEGVCLVAEPSLSFPSPLEGELSWEWLCEENLDIFFKVKTEGWNVPHELHSLLHRLIEESLSDPNSRGVLLRKKGVPCAAGNLFIQGKWAYLRGDCVLPAFRGQGIHKKLIGLRMKVLYEEEMEHVVTLADEATSSKSFGFCGFRPVARFQLWSPKPSPWLSP